MLKNLLRFRWWIVAVLLCAIGIPFMAYQKHRSAEKYRDHRADYCAAFMPTQEQKVACEEEKANPDDYLQWGYKLFEWPEGITAWAIIATGFAIGWQAFLLWGTLGQIKVQASHMERQIKVQEAAFAQWVELKWQVTDDTTDEKKRLRIEVTVKNTTAYPLRLLGGVTTIGKGDLPHIKKHTAVWHEEFIPPRGETWRLLHLYVTDLQHRMFTKNELVFDVTGDLAWMGVLNKQELLPVNGVIRCTENETRFFAATG